MTTYAGIDIGLKGAIAFIDATPGSVPFACAKMPLVAVGKRQEVDVVSLYATLTQFGDLPKVIIEECPHHAPSMAAVRSLALSFGKILGMLAIKQVPVIIVPAQKWQREMLGKLPKGTTKAAALGLARRLWPKEDFKHEGMVDACLIAEWARRQRL